MSFNESIRKSNGLVLPSFSQKQPTVSLSEVSGVSTTVSASLSKPDNQLPQVANSTPIDVKPAASAHNEAEGILAKAYDKKESQLIQTTTSYGRGELLNDDSSEDEECENENHIHDNEEDEDVSSSEEVHDEKLALKQSASIDDVFEGSSKLSDDKKEEDENDEEIENEVADEVRKSSIIPVPTPEDVIMTVEEQRDQKSDIKVNRVRTDSIKDIPNPSPNLKKQKAFDFQLFLKDFKSQECEPLHKYLRSFLAQFSRKSWTVEEQIKLIRDFQIFLFNKLIEYKPFNEMGVDDIKIDNCKEGLEKLVMTRVYSQVFTPEMSFLKLTDSHKHDKIQDRKYLIQLNLYDWIELRHLDVDLKNQVDDNFMQLATTELQKINQYKSPRDKIICILNSSKVIFGLIRQQKTQESADSFVPLLIYVLLKAKVKNLYSNLQYIERFRNEEFLVGETSYYVSTLQIALNFIVGINKDQLTITEEEYNEKLDLAKQRLRALQQKKNEESSPGEIISKSAEMMKQSLSNTFSSIMDSIDGITSDSDQQSASESMRSSPVSELERIKQLSIEEHNREESMHRKQEDVFKNLKSMFSNIDDDIIQDVMACCVDSEGVNIGECVNNLLILGE